MESRAKLAGHPIHQMLVVFPLGLFMTAVAFDIVWMFYGVPGLTTAAYYNLLVGVLGALAAAVFGLVDYLAIPRETRARKVGTWHGVGNLAVVALFAASWWLRRDQTHFAPSQVAFLLGLGGAVLGTMTAWMGGELVDRLGVGVYPDANLDAPSSLSGDRSKAPSRTRGLST
jgi:uncharacterized membrane protein